MTECQEMLLWMGSAILVGIGLTGIMIWWIERD